MPEPLHKVADAADSSGSADPGDRSLTGDLRALADTARTYATAELAYQKARAGFAAAEGRAIAARGAVAAVFAFFALMALVFGLVLSLSTVIGPWLATLVVVGVLAVAAMVLLLGVKSRSARLVATLKDGPEKPA